MVKVEERKGCRKKGKENKRIGRRCKWRGGGWEERREWD